MTNKISTEKCKNNNPIRKSFVKNAVCFAVLCALGVGLSMGNLMADVKKLGECTHDRARLINGQTFADHTMRIAQQIKEEYTKHKNQKDGPVIGNNPSVEEMDSIFERYSIVKVYSTSGLRYLVVKRSR